VTQGHETTGTEPFTLRDGRELRFRRIRRDDAPRLADFAARLSPNSLRLRFFTPIRTFDPEFLERLADVDFKKRAAFVATFPDDDAILAVGRYADDGDGIAEVAFIVLDELQGNGIASHLLLHLAQLARANGYEEFTANLLAENVEMMDVFVHSGFPMTAVVHGGVEAVRMRIAP
jgi:GNAT superfamily N-acetyltransferase